MTDKMTDEQVNEAIFKAKGWVYLPPPAVPAWQRPTNSDVDCRFWYFSFPPDYTNEWRLAGELLEEMKDKCLVSLMNGRLDNPHWVCGIFANPRVISTNASTPQRAICEAWLAWKDAD